jgi:hypothetical protein
MEYRDFLLTLAEVSVAIVAFVTIILVVRQSTGQQLSSLQVLVARALIEMGLLALLFSLLPILVSYFGVTGSALWRWLSGTLALCMGLIWGFWPYRRSKIVKASDPPPGLTYYTIVPPRIRVKIRRTCVGSNRFAGYFDKNMYTVGRYKVAEKKKPGLMAQPRR